MKLVFNCQCQPPFFIVRLLRTLKFDGKGLRLSSLQDNVLSYMMQEIHMNKSYIDRQIHKIKEAYIANGTDFLKQY